MYKIQPVEGITLNGNTTLGKSTFAFNFLPRGLISSSFVITEVLESTKYCRVL